MILTYFLLAVILISFKLTYDGFKYRGWHRVSEIFGMGLIAILIAFPFLWVTDVVSLPESWTLDYPQNLWKIFVAVLLFWFGCYDTLLNWIMGQKWYYIGTTKWYDDKFIRPIANKISISMVRFIQLLCFLFGSLILLKGNTDTILNFTF